MKKYPYSYDAIRELYDRENRKGNIDISLLPQEYQDLVILIREKQEALNIIRKTKIRDLDDNAKVAHHQSLQIAKIELQKLREQKELVLSNYLVQVEREINNGLYRFEIERDNIYSTQEKEIFHTKKHDIQTLIMSKLLCADLSSSFKAKTANRHQIMSSIKQLLCRKP